MLPKVHVHTELVAMQILNILWDTYHSAFLSSSRWNHCCGFWFTLNSHIWLANSFSVLFNLTFPDAHYAMIMCFIWGEKQKKSEDNLHMLSPLNPSTPSFARLALFQKSGLQYKASPSTYLPDFILFCQRNQSHNRYLLSKHHHIIYFLLNHSLQILTGWDMS